MMKQKTKKEIKEVRKAVRLAVTEVRKREKIKEHFLYEGRKGVAGVWIIGEDNSYCMKFQKNFFYKFYYYDDYGDKIKTPAVSFRSDQLYICRDKNIIPMIVLSDGKIYTYPADKWIEWSIKHKDKGFNVIATPKNRRVKTDLFAYYNIPISLMERYNHEGGYISK